MKKGKMPMIIFIVLLTLLTGGCEDMFFDGFQQQTVLVRSVTVSATGGKEELAVGETLQMSAQVEPQTASKKTVCWTVENSEGAFIRETRASISSSGLLTAIAPGSVVVTATAHYASKKKGTKTILIVAGTLLLKDLGAEGDVYQIIDNRGTAAVWTVDFYLSKLSQELQQATGWKLIMKGQEFFFSQNIFNSDMYGVNIPDTLTDSLEEIRNAEFVGIY